MKRLLEPGTWLRWLFPLSLAGYVWFVNAWASDDAYITFRTVDNLLGGHGLTWNTAERVQAYTNPLWMLLVSATTGVVGDVFYASMLLSALCSLTAIGLALAAVGQSVAARWLLLGLLLSSKAFVDYTASGLENPLNYLLLAAMLRLATDPYRRDSPATAWSMLALASLAFVNRMDTVTLTLPLAAHALAVLWRDDPAPRRLASRLLLATAPAWGWLAFATLYYGFPFPNTAYAKLATGLGWSERVAQGALYFANSLRFDPLTLIVIAVALGLGVAAVRRGARPLALAASGILLNLVYVLWVGGDFMSGRFFASAFLVASLLVVRRAWRAPATWWNGRGAGATVGVALIALNVVLPWAPIRSTASYRSGWKLAEHHGIADERGFYFRHASLLLRLRHGPESFPVSKRHERGVRLRDGDETVATARYIGFYGFAAGPRRHVVDQMGLAEPLLARLPAEGERIGHYARAIPAGLLESVEHDENRLADPGLRAYYDRIRTVTRGPLLSGERLRAIVYLNLVKRAMLDYRPEIDDAATSSVGDEDDLAAEEE